MPGELINLPSDSSINFPGAARQYSTKHKKVPQNKSLCLDRQAIRTLHENI